MFKVLACLLCFYLTGCQMAMDLAPVISREDRVDVSLGKNKGRPIAYDSAVIDNLNARIEEHKNEEI